MSYEEELIEYLKRNPRSINRYITFQEVFGDGCKADEIREFLQRNVPSFQIGDVVINTVIMNHADGISFIPSKTTSCD